LGAALGAPVYELDRISHQDGIWQLRRSNEDRQRDIQGIVSQDCWLTEGCYVGWTADLFEAADVIIWLDHAGLSETFLGILKRAWRELLTTARPPRPARHRPLQTLRQVRRGVPAATFTARDMCGTLHLAWCFTHQPAVSPADAGDGITRGTLMRVLSHYAGKVIHCRTAAEVSGLGTELQRASANHQDLVAI